MLEPYARAQALLGVPFRPQGRDPEAGLDCIGLVIQAFSLADVGLPRYRLTGGSWEEVERVLSRWFDPAANADIDNLVAFRLSRGFHFGVVGQHRIIHADLAIGKVVARMRPAFPEYEARQYKLRKG